MPVFRARTLAELVVGLLLLGGACSTSPEGVGDAGKGIDGPAAVGASDVNPVVDSPAAQASDVNQVVDGRVAGETERGDSGIACSGEYRACECGCCDGGVAKTACYYPSWGQTVASVEADDRAMSTPNAEPKCNASGCIRYVCCPALAAEPTSAATYAAEWVDLGGAMSGLQITKKGAECASILTYYPGENYTGIRHSETNWGLHLGNVGACGDGGAGQAGIGGIGTLVFSPKPRSCEATQVSLHATVFGLAADGSVQAVRMDVDNLPSSCP